MCQAIYLINMLPGAATPKQVSSFQCQKLDYMFLKAFGCSCFPFLKPYNKQEFYFKTTKCLILGYSLSHKDTCVFTLQAEYMLLVVFHLMNLSLFTHKYCFSFVIYP